MICYGFLFVFECTMATAAPVVVCPQVPAWSKAYQAQLADEIQRMPAGTATERAIREHIQMRDRSRKCRRKS